MADRKTRKLLKQLHDADPKKRYDAVMALGHTGDLELMDDLDKVANLDEDARVRNLAGQAVEVFATLRRRQIDRDRAAMMAGDDGTFDWPELAQEKILREREMTAAHVKEDSWSYVESKKKQMERMTEEERQKFLEAEERERRRRARRRPMRILIIFGLALALIALAAVVYTNLNKVDQPGTRLAALQELQVWVVGQQDALLDYTTAFANNAVDCAAANAVTLPTEPEWVAKLSTPPFEGLDLIISNLNTIQDYLENSQSAVQTVCTTDVTTVNAADMADYGTLTGEQIRGQRLALTVASNIDQEITIEQAAGDADAAGTAEPAGN